MLAGSSIWVAANREDADRILGWVCGDPGRALLHWVWVREPWRRAGIASELVGCVAREALGLLVLTGWTLAGAELARRLVGLKAWPDCYRPDLGR